jgi:hypothetical protein
VLEVGLLGELELVSESGVSVLDVVSDVVSDVEKSSLEVDSVALVWVASEEADAIDATAAAFGVAVPDTSQAETTRPTEVISASPVKNRRQPVNICSPFSRSNAVTARAHPAQGSRALVEPYVRSS